MALFLFLGPKPRGLNFAEIYARGGRGLQRPTFRDLIPPLGAQPLRAGPRRHSAVLGRAVAGAHGAVPGAALGAGPGRRAGSAAAQHAVSGGVCRVWGAPSPCGGAARRKGAFSLYKEARRSAGFSLSNQSCSGPITLCFRSGCFFGGAE